MGMSEKHGIDAQHLFHREVTHAGAGVHEDIVIEHQAGSPQVSGDPTGAPQYGYSHLISRTRSIALPTSCHPKIAPR
jgi:hypothetical protein